MGLCRRKVLHYSIKADNNVIVMSKSKLTSAQVKTKVLVYKDWWSWAERPFGAFILSLFAEGEKREYMRKAGVDVYWPATLFQNGAFFKSEKVWDLFAKELEAYLKAGGTVKKVVLNCEKYGRSGSKQIEKLNKSKFSTLEKFEQLAEILYLDPAFVWLTHGLEHIYRKRLYKEAAKYVAPADLDKFIGDVSYPIKKNAHHYLEAALKGSQPLEKIRKQWGWIKARDGFSEGFTIAELKKERIIQRQTKHDKFKRPKVPKALQKLVAVTQDLVYLRTLRTDILYQLMWQARPIFKDVAKKYNIKFEDLRDYAAQDLLSGKLKKYARNVTYVSYANNYTFFNKPILKESYGKAQQIKGIIANHGIVRGQAKIVKTAYEIDKVKKGDILFAPTTAPSFIMGMKRAAAFVTDEGGITSHAAITSREMRKPCIIGTKIGTKIFKDGDLVEVDANKGVVRRL